MGKGYRFGLAVLLAVSLSLGPWLALAEAGAAQPDGPEQTPRVISSLEGLMDYFAQCEREYGRAFAVKEGESVLNRFPDEYIYHLAVLGYFDPMKEPEISIAAGERVIGRLKIGPYPDGVDHGEFMSCSSAYSHCLAAYFQLGNEKGLLRCADWLLSYVEADERGFIGAIAACGTLVEYYDQKGNEEKTVNYAKQLEAMLSTYGKQYPQREEVLKVVYQMFVVPYITEGGGGYE